MANAFFLPLTQLFAALRALVTSFPRHSTQARPAAVPRPDQRSEAPARRTPLRVVRLVEPSAPRAVAGRMVISGRLADVCAELDRLAALEAGNEPAGLPAAVGWR
jgi:hypothetical protein